MVNEMNERFIVVNAAIYQSFVNLRFVLMNMKRRECVKNIVMYFMFLLRM